MKNLVIVTLCCCFAIACAKTPTNNVTETNASEAPAIRSVDVVQAKPQELTLSAGEAGEALIALQITNGYHVNANPASFSYLIATNLEITPADGIAVEFLRYPDPITRKFPFAEKPLAVYEGQTNVKAQLKASKSTKPGQHNLSAKLRVQACDEHVCYAPGTIDLTVPVNVK